MKTLTKLNKLAPGAVDEIEREVLRNLAPGCAPIKEHELIRRINAPMPQAMPAGVVLRAVLGKLADEGKIIETFSDDYPRPLYRRVTEHQSTSRVSRGDTSIIVLDTLRAEQARGKSAGRFPASHITVEEIAYWSALQRSSVRYHLHRLLLHRLVAVETMNDNGRSKQLWRLATDSA